MASDFSDLVTGACRQLESWKWAIDLKNLNNHQDHVQNKHWRILLALVRDLEDRGVEVQFCEIDDQENQARDLANPGVIMNGHFPKIYGLIKLLGAGDGGFYIRHRLSINNVPTISAQDVGPGEACATMANVRIPIRECHSAAAIDEQIRLPLDAIRLIESLTAVIAATIYKD